MIGLKQINERFLLAGCSDGTIKEFDLVNNCVAYSLQRKDIFEPIFTIKYIQIFGKNMMFSHSHKGLIEFWINS